MVLGFIRRLIHPGEAQELTAVDIFRHFFLLWLPALMLLMFFFLILMLAGYIVPGIVVGLTGFMAYFMAFERWKYRINQDAQGKPWFSPLLLCIRPDMVLRLDMNLKTEPVIVTTPRSIEMARTDGNIVDTRTK